MILVDAGLWLSRTLSPGLCPLPVETPTSPAPRCSSDHAYYRFNWDNVSWGVNVLLADMTGAASYHTQLAPFFNTWLYGDAVVPM